MERLTDAICATCALCEFMPVQTTERLLVMEPVGSVPKVLVIDDAFSQKAYAKAIGVAQVLLGSVDFSYTTSIRCTHSPTLTTDQLTVATSRCAVWTHQLVEGRSLILTTKRGLQQMKLDGGWAEGEAFRSTRLGVVLRIPSLLSLDIKLYQPKVQRVLREAGLS